MDGPEEPRRNGVIDRVRFASLLKGARESTGRDPKSAASEFQHRYGIPMSAVTLRRLEAGKRALSDEELFAFVVFYCMVGGSWWLLPAVRDDVRDDWVRLNRPPDFTRPPEG